MGGAPVELTTDDRRRTTDDGRPTTDDRRWTTDDGRPTTEGVHSAVEALSDGSQLPTMV